MPLHSTVAIVLSTFPADRDAAELAKTLIAEKLVACVNVLPAMQSIYRWQAKVEASTEHQLVMKTSLRRVRALKARLADLHPYDVPEILILTAAAAASYFEWVTDSTASA